MEKQTAQQEHLYKRGSKKEMGRELDQILAFSSILSREAEGISVVSEWNEYFKNKYRIGLNEVLEAASKWREYISIPATAFSRASGGLESAVRFLKEVHKLKFAEIARLLNRDPRTIWTAYQKSKEKEPFYIQPSPTKYNIPVKALATRKHTVTERVCHLLKEHYGLKNRKIAQLIERSDAYVWITLRRYKQKEMGAGK